VAACERTATWDGRRLGGSRKRRPAGRAGMQIAEGVIEHVLRRIDCACPAGCRRTHAAAARCRGRAGARAGVMWTSAAVGRRREGGPPAWPPLLPVPLLAASPVPHALRPAAGPTTSTTSPAFEMTILFCLVLSLIMIVDGRVANFIIIGCSIF